MNPASESQLRLSVWSQEMGFLLPNGMIPPANYFSAATSTRERRELWDAIMRKAKDRRYVKKIRAELASSKMPNITPETKLSNKLENTRKQADKVADEMSRVKKIIEGRIEKIGNIEGAIHELEIKAMLFRRTRNSNVKKAAVYKKVGESIQKLTSFNAQGKNENVEEWVTKTSTEVRSRWCDPALTKEIERRLQDSSIGGDLLWLSLIRNNELIEKTCYETKNEAEKAFVRLNTAPPSLDWAVVLAKQRINCVVTDALTLLLLGQGLDTVAGVNYVIHENTLRTVQIHLHKNLADANKVTETDSSSLETLKLKVGDSSLAYEALRTEVGDLRRMLEDSSKTALASRRALAGLVGDIKARGRTDASSWRATLQRRTSLIHQHTRLIWENPLIKLQLVRKDFEAIMRWKAKSQKCNCNCLVQFNVNVDKEYCDSIDLLLNDQKGEEILEVESGRGRLLARQLRKVLEQLETLRQETVEVWQIQKIISEQPFTKMIPEACEVNGLTMKEWSIEVSLCTQPRNCKNDFSLCPSNF